jgi:hypothetical protein
VDQKRRCHPPDDRALLLRYPRDPCCNLLNESLAHNTGAGPPLFSAAMYRHRSDFRAGSNRPPLMSRL